MLPDLPLPPGSSIVLFARILLPLYSRERGYRVKRHVCVRARGYPCGIPHGDAILRQRVSRLQLHPATAGPPITYSRQAWPLNLSKSRFTRADAREFRAVTARIHGRAHVHINKHTRRSRATTASTGRALSLFLSLSRASSPSSPECFSRARAYERV